MPVVVCRSGESCCRWIVVPISLQVVAVRRVRAEVSLSSLSACSSSAAAWLRPSHPTRVRSRLSPGRRSFRPARTASSSSRLTATIVCSSACFCRQMAASMRATMTEKKWTRLHSVASVLNYADASPSGSSSFSIPTSRAAHWCCRTPTSIPGSRPRSSCGLERARPPSGSSDRDAAHRVPGTRAPERARTKS